jgi:antitoxin HicB
MEYAAKITKEGKYTLAEFPDCVGCQTFVEDGESIADAAQDALEGWLESHLGRDLVPPRPIAHRGAGFVRIGVPVGLALRLELRWARAAAGLTQAELARKVGMSQQAVQKLESRQANPTIATLDRVARGLGGSVHLKFTNTEQGAVREARQSYGRTSVYSATRKSSSKATSPGVAAKAAMILRDGRSSSSSKSVPASDLAQARGKSKPVEKRGR